MEINELKNALGSVSAPEQLNYKGQVESSSGFIHQLRKADARSKVIIRRFYITYFIIAAFYLGLFILNPDPDLKFSDRINGTLLFFGIILFAVMGKVKFTELKKIRYDEPARIFLKKALNRYKFWTKEMNYGLILLAFINVGSGRSYIINYPFFESTTMNIIAFELVFFSAIGIGLYFGYRHWSFHKKPTAIEIKSLLNEMG